MRARALTAQVAALVLVLTLMPAVSGQFEVLAIPETVTQHIDIDLEGRSQGLATAGSAASRSEVVEAPLPFSMVGFELPKGVDEVYVRTSMDGKEWSEWLEAERHDASDGPDPQTAELSTDRSGRVSEPVWVGEARYLQVEGPEDARIRATVLDSAGLSGGPVRTEVIHRRAEAVAKSNGPRIVTRQEWGADESLRRKGPSYASKVDQAIIHHTAGSNNYSCADAPAVIRGIYRYHVVSNGWNDIGYNFLIDKCGTIYEGRYGGVDRGVIGAHAAGFNTSSFGVSVLGNYVSVQPDPRAVEAITTVVAWKSALHKMSPTGTAVRSGKSYPAVVGHKDVGQTSCPGLIQGHLPTIRSNAAKQANNYYPFGDVSRRSAHRDNIYTLYSDGVIQGCLDSRFCPLDSVTRQQAASLVARALEIPGESGQQFSDVSSSNPHAPNINALASRGILTGYDDGTFRPTLPMTRAQFATLLKGALGLKDGDGVHFTDVSKNNVHRGAIYALANRQITNGCTETKYCPTNEIRRDQAASLIRRMLEYR